MICRCKRQICADRNLKYICIPDGGLAQLARALPWHGRGHRFDSDILHFTTRSLGEGGLIQAKESSNPSEALADESSEREREIKD